MDEITYKFIEQPPRSDWRPMRQKHLCNTEGETKWTLNN
jgi:hypothetical protein